MPRALLGCRSHNYPFTGTGNLFRFCQGLASIGLQNQAAVILDNDSEGTFAFERLAKLSLPPSMGVLQLPSLSVARRWSSKLTPLQGATSYHGELHAAVRDATQDAFMDGRYRIIVATKAFGMGIDKPNTRLVVHYQLPDSLESYVQEAGRAGRDGEPARCVLLFDEKDAAVQYFFSRQKQPPRRAIQIVLDWLATQMAREELDLSGLEGQLADRWRVVIGADLTRLRLQPTDPRVATLARQLEELYEHREQLDRARIERMLNYARGATCYPAEILRYLDEAQAAACGSCGNCTERSQRVVRRKARSA